jgi:hypothetical protein
MVAVKPVRSLEMDWVLPVIMLTEIHHESIPNYLDFFPLRPTWVLYCFAPLVPARLKMVDNLLYSLPPLRWGAIGPSNSSEPRKLASEAEM